MKVKLLNEHAKLPTRGSPGAAGFDLYSVIQATVAPGAHVIIPTGIAIEMRPGWYGRIAPRSGLAIKHGINLHAGVIDPDYRGELSVAAINHGHSVWHIEVGDRIAQLVLEWHYRGDAEVVRDLTETPRGVGKFGSTGV